MSEANGALTIVPVQPVTSPATVNQVDYFTRDQIDLLKRTIAKGTSDDEFRLFQYQCARTGLDPFSKQIYAIMRNVWNPEARQKEPRMTIQTGIDGFRLIADRTGRYAPGPEPTFEYDNAGKVRKATAYVMKLVAGTWHTVAASAHYAEYVQEFDGKPSGQWTKPHIMLAKCAEALALRKGFPAELSGLYTSDEMSQADTASEYTPPPKTATKPAAPPVEVGERALRINQLTMMKAPDGLGWTKVGAKGWLKKRFGVESTGALTEAQQKDAELLLLARLDSEDTYNTKVEMFANEGRCLGDGEVKE